MMEKQKRTMKIAKNQPWRIWIFVLGLNFLGFLGLYILKGRGIDVYALHSVH